ncbi:Cytosol aminopeptidase [Roseimaritima multifibrata]|uniref:Probable cytosol aminopeptidase n=1 Tax=Roseimaritima multifibrata TaxID=1930274 RepID=A0A517MNH7_9BACT|nr:leucyl aminopeptidase [Roseimaritima multifibrata]QDS96430.1 Cytosol aminopeptidase [Roseimaritima multifibrata]
MEFKTSPNVLPSDCIVLGIDADGQLSKSAQTIDQQAGNVLSRAVKAGDISSKSGKTTLVPLPETSDHAAALVIATGKTEELSVEQAYRLGAISLKTLSDRQRDQIGVTLTAGWAPEFVEAFVAGACAGSNGQGIYLAEPKLMAPKTVTLVGADEAAVRSGQILGNSVNLTRRLVNEPGNVIYPETFAQRAKTVADECGLAIEIWDEKKLEEENCQAILAVGRGSVHPPRLVKITYNGAPDNKDAPVALVGKGVTFDSGGLSLKPSPSMLDMKMDMAGAATVLGVLQCIAQLKLPCNVVGYMGLAENMLDGDNYRLGDVIRSRSGKTIEIHNTDAEGRVVLADVLDVANEGNPASIVDLATLTGACLVALGTKIVGLMGNNDALQSEIQTAAKEVGEHVWPLPMHSFFDEQVRSKVADLKNVGDGRWGGSITAAKFLEAFVGDTPWLHMDIAGPAFADSATPEQDAGGTGAMVRTLVQWLR